MKRIALAGTLLLAAVLIEPRQARADDLQELVRDARDSLLNLTSDPAMDWFRDNVKKAKGVLIIPRLLKGGFIFGGSGGSGVLLARDAQTGAWSYPAFYTLGSVTVGPQIGGEAAELILLIMTQRGLDSMMTSSVKLGADVEVAAGPVGVGTKAATADMLAFSRTKGLFAGTTVEGAWIGEREGWNEQYYSRHVRPIEILLDHKVTNSHADGLREAMARVSGSVPTSQSPSPTRLTLTSPSVDPVGLVRTVRVSRWQEPSARIALNRESAFPEVGIVVDVGGSFLESVRAAVRPREGYNAPPHFG